MAYVKNPELTNAGKPGSGPGAVYGQTDLESSKYGTPGPMYTISGKVRGQTSTADSGMGEYDGMMKPDSDKPAIFDDDTVGRRIEPSPVPPPQPPVADYPFNVYWSGDAGGETLANVSWVPDMVNIDYTDGSPLAIASGVTITLQPMSFDTGDTKNYPPAQSANTVEVFGRGANVDSENNNFLSVIQSDYPIVKVTLYIGDFELFGSSGPYPVEITQADSGVVWIGLSPAGTLKATWSNGFRTLTLTDDTVTSGKGEHIFGGIIRK